MSTRHHIQDIQQIFDLCFYQDFNTRLVRGGEEPIYLPAEHSELGIPAESYHQVVFAHGYYASALHEIAHWCLAGEARRQLVDFGYWYCPDGRSGEQQAAFQQAEIKPQAIEWGLAMSCGFEFNVSCDNLSGDEFDRQPDRFAFEADILAQVQVYLAKGFPPRARRLMVALSDFYGRELPTEFVQFQPTSPNVRCA